MKSLILSLCLTAILGLAISGCATNYIAATSDTNPPPAVAFKEYQKFDLREATLSDTYAGQEANEKAANKIREVMENRVGGLVRSWNSQTEGVEGKTLVIEPRIKDIKFISGGTRFWAGAMAGSSAVLMEVEFRDAKTGEVIAKPEFYQHANAYGGAWTFGSTDNDMLDRIVDVIYTYTANNYAAPVGGPTGRPVE